MSPGASSLVAALVAVCAVLVACGAVGMVLLAMRLRVRLGGARARLARATVTVEREAPRARQALDRISAMTGRIGREDGAMDRRLAGMTASLLPIRRAIEGLTQGRLATLIRGASMVSKAAQFALLWR